MTERGLAHGPRARLAAGDVATARSEVRRLACSGNAASRANAHLLLSACAKRIVDRARVELFVYHLHPGLDAIASEVPHVPTASCGIAGADELVARDADDYVRIATRLVDDAAWRASLRESIRSGLDRIFETRAPVDAFAELLPAD